MPSLSDILGLRAYRADPRGRNAGKSPVVMIAIFRCATSIFPNDKGPEDRSSGPLSFDCDLTGTEVDPARQSSHLPCGTVTAPNRYGAGRLSALTLDSVLWYGC